MAKWKFHFGPETDDARSDAIFLLLSKYDRLDIKGNPFAFMTTCAINSLKLSFRSRKTRLQFIDRLIREAADDFHSMAGNCELKNHRPKR